MNEKREDYDTAINYIELIVFFFNRYSTLLDKILDKILFSIH